MHQLNLTTKHFSYFIKKQNMRLFFTDSTDWSPLSYIMLIAKITGLILMTGITVAVNRGDTAHTEKPQLIIHK